MVSTNEAVASETVVSEMPVAEIISEEDFEKAQKTFQTGKKNLFLNKFDESVNNIGDACKVFSSKYGEMDPRCAEVYYFYGRALLELARVESTVLGNALNGVPEETGPIDDSRYGNPEDVPADEKEEISEKVIDAMCNPEVEATPAAESNGAPAAESTTATAETPAAETIADAAAPVIEATAAASSEESAVEAKPATEAASNGEAAAAAEGEEEEGDEEEEEQEGEDEDLTKAKDDAENEEVSNLQQAWEMFELAKLIYTKNFDNDLVFKNKRIAECLLKLGEISIEQEIYDQAITDITESIRLQETAEAAERDERMLAESYYQLGLAQQFNNQFKEANETYQKSINIVQLRIEKLRGKLSTIEGNEADAELERTGINDEISELEALLPEMTAKLEEVNEQGQQSLSLIKEAKECFMATIENAAATTTPSSNVNGGEVKDITNLVKSKRKISATSTNVDEIGATKKTRLSNEGVQPSAAESETTTNTNGNHVEEANNVEMTTETVAPATETAAAPAPITAE